VALRAGFYSQFTAKTSWGLHALSLTAGVAPEHGPRLGDAAQARKRQEGLIAKRLRTSVREEALEKLSVRRWSGLPGAGGRLGLGLPPSGSGRVMLSLCGKAVSETLWGCLPPSCSLGLGLTPLQSVGSRRPDLSCSLGRGRPPLESAGVLNIPSGSLVLPAGLIWPGFRLPAPA
jgi:hypothetical protein